MPIVRGVLIASGEYDSQRFEDYKKHLGKCISQMKAYKNRVQNFWGEEKATTQEPINELINILSKFPSVARQLSFRHDNRDTLQIQ
jgi:hypothetical protein